MNRRGFSAASMFLQVILLFVIALAGITAWYFMNEIDMEFRNDTNIPANTAAKFTDSKDKMDDSFDSTILVLMIGVTMGLAATSFVLRSNPVMFFIVLLLVTIVAMVAGYLSNAWNDTTGGVFLDTIDHFPITEFLMQNYMIVTIVNAFIMLIVFFAKPGGGGEF